MTLSYAWGLGMSSKTVVPSSYARMSDLIDANDPKHAALRDVGGSTIAQIFDISPA